MNEYVKPTAEVVVFDANIVTGDDVPGGGQGTTSDPGGNSQIDD